MGRPWAPSCVALVPSKPGYWYAAFIVRAYSSASSSVGLSYSPTPGFVGGATGLGSVIDVTPGTVISRRPTFTRSWKASLSDHAQSCRAADAD
jgi:hypothetical protein